MKLNVVGSNHSADKILTGSTGLNQGFFHSTVSPYLSDFWSIFHTNFFQTRSFSETLCFSDQVSHF